MNKLPDNIQSMSAKELDATRCKLITDNTQFIHEAIDFIMATGETTEPPTGWSSATIRSVLFGNKHRYFARAIMTIKAYVPADERFASRISLIVIDTATKRQIAHVVFMDNQTNSLINSENFIVPGEWINALESEISNYVRKIASIEFGMDQAKREALIDLLTNGLPAPTI